MNFRLIGSALIGSALLGSVLGGCGSEDVASSETDAEIGTVSIALTSTLAGVQYRLKSAHFTAESTSLGGTEGVVEINGSPNVPAVNTDLLPGTYVMELLDGWTMQQEQGDGSFAPIDAALTHAPRVDFAVEPQTTTSVPYRFIVGENAIEFGYGRAQVTFTVQDCEPIRQIGCAPRERCVISYQLDEALSQLVGRALCEPLPQGVQLLGELETCEDADTGYYGPDLCDAGLECIHGKCRRYCDGGTADEQCGCAVEMPELDLGFCLGDCEVLDPLCPAGNGCYYFGSVSGSWCWTGGTTPDYELCEYSAECLPERHCYSDHPYKQKRCRPWCDLRVGHELGCPGGVGCSVGLPNLPTDAGLCAPFAGLPADVESSP